MRRLRRGPYQDLPSAEIGEVSVVAPVRSLEEARLDVEPVRLAQPAQVDEQERGAVGAGVAERGQQLDLAARDDGAAPQPGARPPAEPAEDQERAGQH